jgi:predicted CXXCH cytochrome family protein
MMLLINRFLAVISLLVYGAAATGAEPSSSVPGYVGSETCAGCHATVTQAWRDSHHAWAWKSPNETTVLGDFANKTIEHGDVISRLSKGGGKFFVTTDGPDGQSRKFEVVGTVGVAPLQQYLVETELGRLQALDLAWDSERKRWYHLYPDQELTHGNGLHWTGPYKNWNARCAECHATGYRKGYTPRTRRYSSTRTEIGVGCEACHGPGSAHLAWANDRGGFDPVAWNGTSATGFTVSFGRRNGKAEIQQCAGCHSRREPLGDASPLPGTPFADSYRLALLRDGLYHADGQIRDEVYVHGSFLQSKMYDRGVRCSDCHEPHSATLKAAGNAVCTQCHQPPGNPEFPSLRKAEYDSPEHHFHPPGTDGAQCKSCHMLERVYMGVDGRRDHSFRVPRPDLSVALGTPNTCTDCHNDKPAAWAAAKLEERFPNSSKRAAHFALPFAAARRGVRDPETARALLAISLATTYAGIVRATALDLLRQYVTPEIADRVAGLLRDPDPLVRAAAIPLQRAAPSNVRARRMGPLLDDDRRSVRLEAARAILDLLAAGAPRALARSARRAVGEYQASLAAKADFPETQMAIAGTALVFRNFRAADRAFSEAVRMDPQRVDAWSMIARIRAAQGDVEGAANALRDGLAANPNDVSLTRILTELRGSARPK